MIALREYCEANDIDTKGLEDCAAGNRKRWLLFCQTS